MYVCMLSEKNDDADVMPVNGHNSPGQNHLGQNPLRANKGSLCYITLLHSYVTVILRVHRNDRMYSLQASNGE